MEYLQIGEIVRPQGIKGEVKLRAMSSDPDRYITARYFIGSIGKPKHAFFKTIESVLFPKNWT